MGIISMRETFPGRSYFLKFGPENSIRKTSKNVGGVAIWIYDHYCMVYVFYRFLSKFWQILSNILHRKCYSVIIITWNWFHRTILIFGGAESKTIKFGASEIYGHNFFALTKFRWHYIYIYYAASGQYYLSIQVKKLIEW